MEFLHLATPGKSHDVYVLLIFLPGFEEKKRVIFHLIYMYVFIGYIYNYI
mgnify:CR=1 FL=1